MRFETKSEYFETKLANYLKLNPNELTTKSDPDFEQNVYSTFLASQASALEIRFANTISVKASEREGSR